VCQNFDGSIELFHDNKKLDYKCFDKGKAPKLACKKGLDEIINNIKKEKNIKYKPAKDHPWRQYKIQTKPLSKTGHFSLRLTSNINQMLVQKTTA
jgi:hypothetical protein